MHTDPEIITTDDLTKRAYVKVYIDGRRHRFYNGKVLSLICNPNHCKTVKDRDRALSTLRYALRKKLEEGWKPPSVDGVFDLFPATTTTEALRKASEEIAGQDLSDVYKRDVIRVYEDFVSYLRRSNLAQITADRLNRTIIQGFLNQYGKSATYYMNKRRTLSGIFSRLVSSNVLSKNPVAFTTSLKVRAKLHEAYGKRRLYSVLEHLDCEHPNLFLCAKLMYGCFLRPHKEIRTLTRGNFNEDLTMLTLSGDANKGGKIRAIPVPFYVSGYIKHRGLHLLSNDCNLFTWTRKPYNASYFNTAWSRIKKHMLEKKIIGKNHTLYSFRHTGAINLYMQTKDIYKVQMAMGHSSMAVTLTYMRSLGLINKLNAEDVPEL